MTGFDYATRSGGEEPVVQEEAVHHRLQRWVPS